MDPALLVAVDDVVRDAVASGGVPGVVVGLADGRRRHVVTAGVVTLGGSVPVRRDTLFRISSMTKPLTAATVLSMVEEGLVDLDGPLDDLVPELAHRQVLRRPDGPLDDVVPAEQPVTVRSLLTSTWGLGQQGAVFAGEPWPVVVAAEGLGLFGPPDPAGTPPPQEWIAGVGRLPLMAPPGERWLYHVSSQVLGVVVARAAGRPFDEELRRRVTEPLGMTATAFHGAADRLTALHEPADDGPVVSDPPDGAWSRLPAFPDGAGGLVSTVDDYLAFGRALLDGGAGVLRPDTVAEMTRDRLTPAQRRHWPGFDMLGGIGWGFGLGVADGAYGWQGGLGSDWASFPDRDLTLVVLTNLAAGPRGMPPVVDDVLRVVTAA